MSRRYRAPTANGAVLAEPGFDAIPPLVEANRKLLDRTDVLVGGLPLRELRALARREVLELARDYTDSPALRAGLSSDDGPLLLSGHQPELSHPGVWVKNFALNGLARKLGGVPLHLIVDNDTLKSTSLRFPVWKDRDPASVRIENPAFDLASDGLPYEHALIRDGALFASFGDRAATLTENWPFAPLFQSIWPELANHPPPWIGERFTFARRRFELAWGGGNFELPISRLAESDSFAHFVCHLASDAPHFAQTYNAAVGQYRDANGSRSEQHPVPDLTDSNSNGWVELPFWGQQYGGYLHARRGRAFACTGTGEVRIDDGPPVAVATAVEYLRLRPRALTLTLFARVCLGDFFIHGIGGGKYDEVTDAIIRDYFGIEPPAYQVLSATLHLPLPAFPSTEDDLKRAERRVRDLQWNPQNHLTVGQRTNPDVKTLLETHTALAANEPPYANHAARRERFRALKEVKDHLRMLVADQMPLAESELTRVRSEVNANAILQRRDYAWVLYPEEMLREFLQGFLDEPEA